MFRPGPTVLLAMAMCVLAVAHVCGESPVTHTLADKVSIYDARGVLQSVDRKNDQATIAHDAIPGYMPAMTMAFAVHDITALASLKPGDLLTFHLCVAADRAWIEEVNATGDKVVLPFAPEDPDATPSPHNGDLFPDVELVNERSQTVRTRDLAGNALAVTFIYTRCPLPTYCPLMNRNFQTAQALLARLGAGDNWRFLSVSLDPSHDTTDILATFAKDYEADARHWNFVTASETGVRQLGAAVGLEFNITQNRITHNLRTAVIDGTGHIRRIFRGNDWTPQELAAEMCAAMAGAPSITQE